MKIRNTLLKQVECTSVGHESQKKREKGMANCAECRRRKLRCNREIPCNNCRDGTRSELCPNGRKQTSQGTRFVLAATQPLQRRVVLLQNRIEQLEELLASLRNSSSESHHLLCENSWEHEDNEIVISGEEGGNTPADNKHHDSPGQDFPDLNDTFSTLLISNHGVSHFFGATGHIQSLLYVLPSAKGRYSLEKSLSHKRGDRVLFSSTFPFICSGPTAYILRVIEAHLPPYDQAKAICKIYVDRIGWIYYALSKSQLLDEMLPTIYSRQFYVPLAAIEQSAAVESYSNPHDIALLFIALGIGSLLEPDLPMAEHFYELSRVALMLNPVLEKPSVTTIQTLHLMSVYNGIAGNEFDQGDANMELTWSLKVMAIHLSYSIGLHRDCSRWGMSQSNMDRRQTVLWDIFKADIFDSLVNGRPPGFSKKYIDCQYPRVWDNSSACLYVLSRFAAEVGAEVSHTTLELQSYESVIEIDSKLRRFSFSYVNIETDKTTTDFLENLLALNKAIYQMYLHRAFYIRAVIEQPQDPFKSRYATSFFASYRAASFFLKQVNEMFNLFPSFWSRCWLTWTYSLYGAVIFGTIVAKAPRTPLAMSAMEELEKAYDFFVRASDDSIHARTALPILSSLRDKALYALSIAQSTTKMDKDSLPIYYDGSDEDFASLAGKSHLLNRSLVTIEKVMPLPETIILYVTSDTKRVRVYDLDPR